MTWRVERARGSAAAFHARSMPDPPERTVWVFAVDRPAIVLGSRQSPDEVRAPDGVEVVRRHSGGGAVWLEPASALWVDVVVPRDDPLWDDDVGRAAHWLGAVWARAAGEGAVVHRGPLQRTRWSGAVCFAGLGPGEVTVGGRKVVGISQRRTRAAARFQCVAYERWDPAPLLGALGLPADAVVPGGTAGPIVALEAAFLAEMP